MGLFKKRKKVDSARSKALDKAKLITGDNFDKKQVEEIVKTTDSMRIVASSFKNSQETESQKFEESSKALLRSYDLATRKISNTYEEIIETKKVVSNDFLTVQIMIRDYEKNNNIDLISKAINIFADELEHQIANGRSVKIDNKLIIEPADYVNKMIPIARYITKDYVNVNTVSWYEIAKLLRDEAIFSAADVETVGTLVEAIMTNIDNGYYVKFGNLVLTRVRPEASDLMVLFSKETIIRLNKIYSGDRLRRRSRVLSKNNYIANYKEAKENKLAEDTNIIEKIDQAEKDGKTKRNLKIKDVLDRENEVEEKISKTLESSNRKSEFFKKQIEKLILNKNQKDNSKKENIEEEQEKNFVDKQLIKKIEPKNIDKPKKIDPKNIGTKKPLVKKAPVKKAKKTEVIKKELKKSPDQKEK